MKVGNVNPAIFQAFAFIAQNAYEDARAHGLYDDVNLCPQKRSDAFIRRRLTLLIREEVCEMWDAHQDPAQFAEEMADVVIMCMSAAGHLGIDLAAEVKRKMAINEGRPYGHSA